MFSSNPSDSLSFMPAAGSSSRISDGRRTTALAISRRRCIPYGRFTAFSRSTSTRPSEASTLPTSAGSVPGRAAASTFSRTVSCEKSRMFWKVLDRPISATRWALRPAICRPSSSICPPVGWEIPEITLSSVVFPEPLGPINPRISPRCTTMSTPASASTPTKFFSTPVPRRIGAVPSADARAISVGGAVTGSSVSERARRARAGTSRRSRSSISHRSNRPSGRKISVTMINRAIANCTVPLIRGSVHGPTRTPCSTLASVSDRNVMIAAPATAPLTEVRPPITSIARSANVIAK